jgi:hypothetical protein
MDLTVRRELNDPLKDLMNTSSHLVQQQATMLLHAIFEYCEILHINLVSYEYSNISELEY